MKIIKATSIMKWADWKRYQNIDFADYVEWNKSIDLSHYQIVCISHRWITSNHPDPYNRQLQEVKKRLTSLFTASNDSLKDVFVFYDYCSVPQLPRTNEEEAQFLIDLDSLEILFSNANKVIILSEGYADYKNRAWCFLEGIISNQNIYFFEDQSLMQEELSFLNGLFQDISNYTTFSSYDIADKYQGKKDTIEGEVIIASFQHLRQCKITNLRDFTLIKEQMIVHYNKQRSTAFGRLLTAMNKYFNISLFYCSSISEANIKLIKCKPYFEDPTWTRLTVQNLRVSLDNKTGYSDSIYALSETERQFLVSNNISIMPILQLSVPGVDNIWKYIRNFQQDNNWRSYYVDPYMIGQTPEKYLEISQYTKQLDIGGSVIIYPERIINTNEGNIQNTAYIDHFPSINHVIHTLLETQPNLIYIKSEPEFLYMPFMPED